MFIRISIPWLSQGCMLNPLSTLNILKENSYVDLIIVLHYILARVKWNKFKDEDGNIIVNKYGYLKESIYNNLRNINRKLKNRNLIN